MALFAPQSGVTLVDVGAVNQSTIVNEFVKQFDAFFITGRVIDRDLATPPASPSDGDVYIVAATGADDWTSRDTELAFYDNGWKFVTPQTDWKVWVQDENVWVTWSGSAWVEDNVFGSLATGITASTTQSQGEQALTSKLNVVSTCANANDVVTLPAAATGNECVVANDGAQTLQVFPASGDSIDSGTVDASVTVTSGSRAWFVAQDATDWIRVV